MTSAGRSSRRWLQVLVPNVKAQARAGRPCWFCGERVDVDLPNSDEASFQVQHIKSWRDHPHLREDPANLAPSHRLCNQTNGSSRPRSLPEQRPPMGSPSRNW